MLVHGPNSPSILTLIEAALLCWTFIFLIAAIPGEMTPNLSASVSAFRPSIFLSGIILTISVASIFCKVVQEEVERKKRLSKSTTATIIPAVIKMFFLFIEIKSHFYSLKLCPAIYCSDFIPCFSFSSQQIDADNDEDNNGADYCRNEREHFRYLQFFLHFQWCRWLNGSKNGQLDGDFFLFTFKIKL